MRKSNRHAARNLFLFGCSAFILCLFSAGLSYAEKRGANVIVTLKDRPPAGGELVAVWEDSLVLLESNSQADLTIDFREIKSVQIVRNSKSSLGLVCGGAVGLGISAAILDPHDNSGEGGFWSGFRNGMARKGKAVGLVLGTAVLGAVIGKAIGEDTIIVVQGNPPLTVKKILWKLRPKARMPDAR